jgi:hypothetical protein
MPWIVMGDQIGIIRAACPCLDPRVCTPSRRAADVPVFGPARVPYFKVCKCCLEVPHPIPTII